MKPGKESKTARSNDRLVSKKKKTFLRLLLRLSVKFTLVVLILTSMQVLLFRFINPPFTVTMLRDWFQKKETTSPIEHLELWHPLKDISPHIRKAVLAGEDQRFLTHHGFDFHEIIHAVKGMISEKGIRGASTITMQVARTVFLWHERNLIRKAAEAYYSILIEIFWSKPRILEVYLNTVDWGWGAVGIEEASRKYFGVSASIISPYQAALLAAVLPSPYKWSPAEPNEYVLKRQERILRDMERMPLVM
ncbi:MAG TPA: monofunctional biosynthetic peptidoglycan transglycosylase [Desulfobacteraceae bacterium]|nr:monofunctional biosynthetic peptidoglycan transglycosylase [Desulfobacteraceae bacterium]